MKKRHKDTLKSLFSKYCELSNIGNTDELQVKKITIISEMIKIYEINRRNIKRDENKKNSVQISI